MSKTESSVPKVTIDSWIHSSGIDRLDAELILVNAFNSHSSVIARTKSKAIQSGSPRSARDDSDSITRVFILAHPEIIIPKPVLDEANKLLARRQNREPLAYIFRVKEFYGRNFIVTPDVLIPRPETEHLVDCVLSLRGESRSNPVKSSQTGSPRYARDDAIKVLDLGTGSGCIGITLKLEHPELEVTLSDISNKALSAAKQNWLILSRCEAKAEAIQINTLDRHANELARDDMRFIKSDLLSGINDRFDCIIANLPYVDSTWQVSPEVKFEPADALYANDNGMELIKKLINQAPKHLSKNGFLILELDPRQMKLVKKHANTYGFKLLNESPFGLVFLAPQQTLRLRSGRPSVGSG